MTAGSVDASNLVQNTLGPQKHSQASSLVVIIQSAHKGFGRGGLPAFAIVMSLENEATLERTRFSLADKLIRTACCEVYPSTPDCDAGSSATIPTK